MLQPNSRKFRFASWLRRVSTRMIMEEITLPVLDIPVIPSKPAKDILLYVRSWTKETYILFGPDGEDCGYQNQYPRFTPDVIKNSYRGGWGGDVRDPHSTYVCDIVQGGATHSVIRLGDHFMTIANVDLLNGITRPEQHEEVFGDAHVFAHTDSRRYIRDPNYYWGSHYLDALKRKRDSDLYAARKSLLA